MPKKCPSIAKRVQQRAQLVVCQRELARRIADGVGCPDQWEACLDAATAAFGYFMEALLGWDAITHQLEQQPNVSAQDAEDYLYHPNENASGGYSKAHKTK